MRRLYAPRLPEAQDPRGLRVLLEGEEAHHLLRVLRARPGQAVALFDGRGREVEALLLEGRRQQATLEVVALREAPRPPRPVTLCCAVPRGQRMEWLVEKCTEAGVGRILPLAAARSVRQEASENTLRRWRRAALEAAKQCGRADLPEVHPPAPAEAVLQVLAGVELALASPPARDGSPAAPPPGGTAPLAVFVGPEGGFDDHERCLLAAAGAREFALGRLFLRVETAALLAVHAAVWGPAGPGPTPAPGRPS